MDSAVPFTGLLPGQPTLRRRIKLGAFAALPQRIALRYALPCTTGHETRNYVTHHLTLAGRSDHLFSDAAATLIHRTSRSLPARWTTSPCKPSSPNPTTKAPPRPRPEPPDGVFGLPEQPQSV